MTENTNGAFSRRQAPKSLIYSAIGLLLAFVIFMYGVVVGLYEAPPWETIKFLVVPTEQSQETIPETTEAPPTQDVSSSNANRRTTTGVLKTNLLNFDVRWLNRSQPISGLGGGLSLFDGRVVISRQTDGGLWLLDESERTLMQTDIFMPPSNLEASQPATDSDSPKAFPPRYTNTVIATNDQGDFVVSFHGYNYVEEQCRTLRVVKADLPVNWDQPSPRPLALDWELLFESSPCLSFAESDYPITGYQEGGFVLREPSGDFLFGTGDMGQDGSPERPRIITQAKPATGYGRIFRLDAETMEVSVVAMGARNPQGAALDDEGRIWFVDQGPMGGDEVNLLEADANYGWPFVTYGAHYTSLDRDARYWFHQDVLGEHSGYVEPAHVFVPSIAVSDITYINNVHPNWDGDLLVTGLLDGSIIRLIRDEDRILGQESLKLGARMRSVLSANGKIYFMTDTGVIGYLSPRSTDADVGPKADALALLTSSGCIECHSKTQIPSLSYVYGQPIARQRGVVYSAALNARNGSWTREKLTSFLIDPNAFAPGTTMPGSALSTDQIDQIIDALAVLSEPD